MTDELVVRPVAEDDAADLASLSGQLGYASVESEIHVRLGAISTQADHAVFVAEQEGVLAGWIHVFRADRVESDPFAEIGGLVVDEARRGRGIGRRLVDEAAGWAAGRGLPTLRVRTNVIRTEARAFYERNGFTESKRQAVLARNL